jgi:hypothetical protein
MQPRIIVRLGAAAIALVAAIIAVAPAYTAVFGTNAVVLRTFTAKRVPAAKKATKQTVLLRWTTGAEANLLGFNVYRQKGTSARVKINKALIAAKQIAGGASYTYKDVLRRPPLRVQRIGAVVTKYSLQAVELTGEKIWLKSVTLK